MSRIDNGGDGTALAKSTEAEVRRIVPVQDDSEFAIFLDTAKFEHVWRVAKMFAASSIVPEHFRGKIENCFIACQMAFRLKVDPFMFLQSTYVVHGKPGMEAKLAIALMNTSGLFDGPLEFDLAGEGDQRGCQVKAKLKAGGREITGPRVSIATAKAEGWYGQNQKWKTIPDLMLQYRAASWFGRLYCPERLMGMQTVEEIRDVGETVAEPAMLKGADHTLERIRSRHGENDSVTPKEPASPAPEPQPGAEAAGDIPTSGPALRRRTRKALEVVYAQTNRIASELKASDEKDQSNAGASSDAAQEAPTPPNLSSTAAEAHSEPAKVSDDAIEFCSGPWREFVNRLWAVASEVSPELARLEFEGGITKNARIWPKATDGTHSVPVDKRALIVEAVKAKRMNYKTGVIEAPNV